MARERGLTEAPHVDGRSVRQAEDHFRRAVKARLDVRVDALVSVARAAEVDHLDRAGAAVLEQHVLLFALKTQRCVTQFVR